jgi:hypothetical protein
VDNIKMGLKGIRSQRVWNGFIWLVIGLAVANIVMNLWVLEEVVYTIKRTPLHEIVT